MNRPEMKRNRRTRQNRTHNHLTPLSLSNKKKQASPACEGGVCVSSGGQVTPVTHDCGGSS